MRNKQGWLPITIGLLLVTAALCLSAYNLYDSFRASQSVENLLGRLDTGIFSGESEAELPSSPAESGEFEIPDYVLNPEMEMPVQTIDGQDYIGVLSIPAYDLELPVISQWSYPSLKIAPCRYSGSAYTNDLVIAAHNYPSHFAVLSKLEEGDSLSFTDMDGNVFLYEVALREILSPADVEEMTGSEWDLSLFTCNASGQSRITVRCVHIRKPDVEADG